MGEVMSYDEAVDAAVPIFRRILEQKPEGWDWQNDSAFDLLGELRGDWFKERPDSLSGLSGAQAAMAVTVAYQEWREAKKVGE